MAARRPRRRLRLLAYVYLTLPDVRVLATTDPATTAFMELRRDEAHDAGKSFKLRRRWVPYNRISNQLKRAVIVAEDSAFFEHEASTTSRSASRSKTAGGRRSMRGASTITQQLAKNLYLSPSRNPMRKVRELIITRRLEAALTKRRIFEIYLNLIEWGDGIFGCEAAARAYFGKSAAQLGAERGGAAGRRHHQPARAQPGEADAPAAAPPADHPAADGRRRAAADAPAPAAADAAVAVRRPPPPRSAAATAPAAVGVSAARQSTRRAPMKRVRQ